MSCPLFFPFLLLIGVCMPVFTASMTPTAPISNVTYPLELGPFIAHESIITKGIFDTYYNMSFEIICHPKATGGNSKSSAVKVFDMYNKNRKPEPAKVVYLTKRHVVISAIYDDCLNYAFVLAKVKCEPVFKLYNVCGQRKTYLTSQREGRILMPIKN